MPRPKKKPLQVVFRPREGHTDFVNRLDGFVHVGGNTFGRKRKPLHEETR